MKALSIRGPWWWFILHLPPQQRKDVENRDWPYLVQFRGNVQIHASGGMTLKEFNEACQFAAQRGISKFPEFETLKRGGIVGIVKITDHVRRYASRWYEGPTGLVLAEPYPLPFRPCKGALGFFDPEFDTSAEKCLQTSAEDF